jgi:hypothetical protein
MQQYTFTRELPLWSFEFKSASRLEILSRRDIEQKLIKRAWQDDIFKHALLENSKATLEEFFSIQLPETLELRVLEETERSVYLVLPHNPYSLTSETELEKALGMDLEDVAGWMLEQQKGLMPEDLHNNVLLVAKAWRDKDFKNRLLAEPKATLMQELDLEFQKDVRVTVLEESENQVYIIIPFLPEFALADTEDDLRFINLAIGQASDPSPDPNDTFAPDCTLTFTCPIP